MWVCDSCHRRTYGIKVHDAHPSGSNGRCEICDLLAGYGDCHCDSTMAPSEIKAGVKAHTKEVVEEIMETFVKGEK